MKTVCKASFFHLICIFFFFRIMERIAKNTKPTIQALGRACKKYPKTLPLFISILKKLYISKNISSSPNSDLPVSFTAAKSIISCVSIQSNKKDGPQKIRDGIFRALAGLVEIFFESFFSPGPLWFLLTFLSFRGLVVLSVSFSSDMPLCVESLSARAVKLRRHFFFEKRRF